MKFRSPILSNIIWLFFDKILKIAVTFIVGALIGKYLGPDNFGKLNYVQSIWVVLNPIALMGLEGIIIKHFVADKHGHGVIMGTAIALRFMGAIISFGLAFVYYLFFEGTNTEILTLILVLSLPYFFNSMDVIDYYFQSLVKSRYTVLTKSLVLIVFALVKLYVIYVYKGSIITIATIISIELTLASIFLIVPYITFNKELKWHFDKNLAFVLIKESYPLIISGLLVVSFMRFDQLLLAKFSNFHELGLYSAAVRVIEPVGIITTIILSSIYPAMIQLNLKDRELFLKTAHSLFTAFFYLALLVGVFVCVFSMWIFPILFGKEYLESIPILMVLSIGLIFTFSGGVRAQIFIINNHIIYHSYSAAIGFAVLSIISIILIPRYGAYGAATGVVFSYFVSSMLSSFIFKPIRYIGAMQAWPFRLKGIGHIFK